MILVDCESRTLEILILVDTGPAVDATLVVNTTFVVGAILVVDTDDELTILICGVKILLAVLVAIDEPIILSVLTPLTPVLILVVILLMRLPVAIVCVVNEVTTVLAVNEVPCDDEGGILTGLEVRVAMLTKKNNQK